MGRRARQGAACRSWWLARGACVIAFVLAGGLVAARADAKNCLSSDAAEAVRSALSNLHGVNVPKIRAACEVATLRVCPASGDACADLRLSAPSATCAGDRVGPWCLTLVAGGLDPELSKDIRSAFRGMSRDVWRQPEKVGGTPDPVVRVFDPGWVALVPRSNAERQALDVDARVLAGQIRSGEDAKSEAASLTVADVVRYGLALLLSLGALLSGVGISACVLRRFPSARLAACVGKGALLVLLPLAVGWLLPRVIPLSPSNGIYFAVLAVLGEFIGVAVVHGTFERKTSLLFIVASIVFFVLLEGGVRLLLPPPPVLPRSVMASLLLPVDYRTPDLDGRMRALYPALFPDELRLRIGRGPAQGRATLHVGDSMVFGPSVADEVKFTTLLDKEDAPNRHINAGFASTGPDFDLLLLRQWLPRIHPDKVVLYLFPANDLEDLNLDYPWCNDGPLADFDAPDGPRSRCPDGPSVATGSYLDIPFAIRVTADFSALARHVCGLIWRLGNHESWTREMLWKRLEATLKAIQVLVAREGGLLVAVVLPERRELEGLTEVLEQTDRKGFLDVLARLGIPALDPWETLSEAVRTRGSEALFVNDPPGDCHFGPAGHRLMADWLRARL